MSKIIIKVFKILMIVVFAITAYRIGMAISIY
jgi:hypothetical protein